MNMMKKIRIAVAILLLLVVTSVTPAAGADRPSGQNADRYVDGDIHFNLKSQEKAACVLNMRPMENIHETETFNFDLSGGEMGEYFSVKFTENKGESSFFKKTTDVQIEYNLEHVIGETELNVSVSAGVLGKVYDRGLSLYGDGVESEGDGNNNGNGEDELYLLDREKITSQSASLSLRIVRPTTGAYTAVAVCILTAVTVIVIVCIRRIKMRKKQED